MILYLPPHPSSSTKVNAKQERTYIFAANVNGEPFLVLLVVLYLV